MLERSASANFFLLATKLGCKQRWQKYARLILSQDAIFSVGNYLKAHGYILNNNEKIKEAIWSYNNSDVYVDTVIGAAEKMKPITK